MINVLGETEGAVEQGLNFGSGFLVHIPGSHDSTALMKGRLFRSPRDKLTACDQGGGILIDLVVMVRAVPRLTGNVKEIDGFALIHGQLHGPTGPPFHAFLILFQNAKGIEGMGFLGNLIIALQQLQGVKMTRHSFP